MSRTDKKARRPRHTPPFDWDEIQAMLDGKLLPLTFDPITDEPEGAPGNCRECSKPMRWTYWRNSDMCWQGECGVAGWLPICETCKTWGVLDWTAMS